MMRRVQVLVMLTALAATAGCTQRVTILRPAISIERTTLFPAGDAGSGLADADSTGAASYRDNVITARFAPLPDALVVTLANNTARPISVLWNDAAIVTTSGRASRLARIGYSGEACRVPSPPLTVVPGAAFSAAVVACEEAYSQGLATVITGSHFLGLPEYFPAYTDGAAIVQTRDKLIGQRFELLLPFEVEGSRTQYLFRFRVDSVRVGYDTIMVDANGRRVR